MKLSSALILFIGTTFPLAAVSPSTQDEIGVLLELIECSKQNLQEQQRLLKAILDFKKARDAFINDPTCSKLATTLVKSAMKVRIEMEACQVAHLFSNDFLSEIQFFAQVGQQHKLIQDKA